MKEGWGFWWGGEAVWKDLGAQQNEAKAQGAGVSGRERATGQQQNRRINSSSLIGERDRQQHLATTTKTQSKDAKHAEATTGETAKDYLFPSFLSACGTSHDALFFSASLPAFQLAPTHRSQQSSPSLQPCGRSSVQLLLLRAVHAACSRALLGLLRALGSRAAAVPLGFSASPAQRPPQVGVIRAV